MISLYITDDHPIVLDGLKGLIAGCPDLDLKGVFSAAAETLRALSDSPVDVLLLDINLPDRSGIELSREIASLYPQVAIIILSVHNERAVIGTALENKVKGYLLKNSMGEEIITAIREAAAGRIFLCKRTREIMQQPDAGLALIPLITRREKEVLGLIAQGRTTQQIADTLFISPHTVESHRKNLMEKFQASSMALVIKQAAEFKLI